MALLRGNEAIRDHVSDGKHLFLFKAKGKCKPVEFLSEFESAAVEFAQDSLL